MASGSLSRPESEYSYEVVKIHTTSDGHNAKAVVSVANTSSEVPEPYIQPNPSVCNPTKETASEGTQQDDTTANEQPCYERIDLTDASYDRQEATSQEERERYMALGALQPSNTYAVTVQQKQQQGEGEGRVTLQTPRLALNQRWSRASKAASIEDLTAAAAASSASNEDTVERAQESNSDAAEGLENSMGEKVASWFGELRRVDYIFAIVVTLSAFLAFIAFIVSLATIQSGSDTQVSNLQQVVSNLPLFSDCSTVAEESCMLTLHTSGVFEANTCTTRPVPLEVEGVYTKELKCVADMPPLSGDILSSVLVVQVDARSGAQSASCVCSNILSVVTSSTMQCSVLVTRCPM